jgi:hypothetical protein
METAIGWDGGVAISPRYPLSVLTRLAPIRVNVLGVPGESKITLLVSSK